MTAAEVSRMPKVTLYVKDADMPVWEQARKIAGDDKSLSAIVSEALAALVTQHHREVAATAKARKRMKQTQLESHGARGDAPKHTLRFVGILLAEGADESRIYLTQAGNLLVWQPDSVKRATSHRVYESLDELTDGESENIDDDAIVEAHELLGKDFVVDVD